MQAVNDEIVRAENLKLRAVLAHAVRDTLKTPDQITCFHYYICRYQHPAEGAALFYPTGRLYK
jgi:hypothetical protein